MACGWSVGKSKKALWLNFRSVAMKKSSLTTAVVAGIVGAAGLVSVSNAVNINPDGLGQALIYPYYTVNKGNNTLISVVNTTNQTKAVKVRFLEGRDSLEVLDFNLYMSPFDVWTAAVVSDGPEGTSPAAAPAARMFTSDTSCTVPSPFPTARRARSATSSTLLVREGHRSVGAEPYPRRPHRNDRDGRADRWRHPGHRCQAQQRWRPRQLRSCWTARGSPADRHAGPTPPVPR
jgi:hypothetical protein